MRKAMHTRRRIESTIGDKGQEFHWYTPDSKTCLERAPLYGLSYALVTFCDNGEIAESSQKRFAPMVAPQRLQKVVVTEAKTPESTFLDGLFQAACGLVFFFQSQQD